MLRLLSTFTIILSLTACGGGSDKTPPSKSPAKAETTQPVKKVEPTETAKTVEPAQTTAPKIKVAADAVCPQGFSCDMLSVPKDYTDTSAGYVGVYYGVHKADDTKNRIGVLMMNFGGPGNETVQQAGLMIGNYFPKVITDRFDIVAMDARGSGYSAFADELSGCTADKNCATLLPKIAPFIGTNTVVKDFDQLRQHLNEDTINFLGYSYGTAIGAIYAHDYPKHVRALVLDGPIDPTAQNYAQTDLGNAVGSDKIATYRLTPDRKVALTKLDKYVHEHDLDYLYRTDDGAVHNVSKGLMEVLTAVLSGDESQGTSWSDLKVALFNLVDLHVKPEYLGYSYANDEQENGLIEAQRMEQMFTAVTCRDERQPISENDLTAMTDKFNAASEIYGWRMQKRAHMCVDAGIKNDPTPDITHMNQVLPASLQVLVIAGQYDPNTPYAWSDEMMKSFGDSASRITVNNLVQHTFSYHNDDKLKQVDDLTTAYLLNPENRISNTTVDYSTVDVADSADVADAPVASKVQMVHPAQKVTNLLNSMNYNF